MLNLGINCPSDAYFNLLSVLPSSLSLPGGRQNSSSSLSWNSVSLVKLFAFAPGLLLTTTFLLLGDDVEVTSPLSSCCLISHSTFISSSWLSTSRLPSSRLITLVSRSSCSSIMGFR